MDSDVPDIDSVSAELKDAGTGNIELQGIRSDVDLRVAPIREPGVDIDVTIEFTVFEIGTVTLSLPEDDALALIDSIEQALEVDGFDELY
ncbi:hypothetical protein NDI54_20955 [Haloarcula sp. S1AR25-5A]|uniref:Uncharacterized protein n=1 Tax=Haloarcula terrestris TaxID=2950533 RepID=A0AAE4F3T9_9EURY|nr:hypothetical protein [Haloarcula terrestris]MDS0223801.1 hypothetical protein [Haloarcula terrestris]